MQVNCTHSGGEVWQGLNMKQLLINDLQIICCPFRWTKGQRMKEVMKQSPFLFLYWFLLQILTVSSGSSSDGHQARSAREAARYPVAPLGSPFFRLQWGNWHPPVHRPESGKKGTCPGSSAPGPLHHRNTAQTAGIQFQITGSRAAHVQTHITQSLTVVENTFFQQHLPHAYSLNARVDAWALLQLPVNQFCPHTTPPRKDKCLYEPLHGWAGTKDHFDFLFVLCFMNWFPFSWFSAVIFYSLEVQTGLCYKRAFIFSRCLQLVLIDVVNKIEYYVNTFNVFITNKIMKIS